MTGRVVLVGGGPGAPDLITVRGLDRLLEADVVVVDRLAPTGLLDRLGPHVEIVDASRTPTGRLLSREEIDAALVDRAREGKVVVRLQGGDPFVFAHGFEEVQACLDAGVPVEVVPGVTSAVAVPGLAAFPLTALGGARGFTVVSGNKSPDDPACGVDWPAVARTGTTLVVLMGTRHLAAITARLIEEGIPADTAAVCVADASLPTERTVRAPLADLARDVAEAGLANPAVVVVSAPARSVARRTLVLGGSRSGKSAFAESLLRDEPAVDYIATTPARADDPEWAERVARHRARRDARWGTVETLDIAGALRTTMPSMIDSVTTWLAATMDGCGSWEGGSAAARQLAGRVDEFVDAFAASAGRVVAVSDEVGSGIVPETRSGRLFRDALGELNQRLAAAADDVWFVTAGLPRRLK